MASKERTALVTVGSTKFDALIKAVDDPAFAKALRAKGYTRLLIQKGNGPHVPRALVPEPHTSTTLDSGLYVEFFDYKLNLFEVIAASDLIISHAGSGSIFEALSLGKALIVVPNPLLMDNHQAELAEQLASMKHLLCASPSGLTQAIKDLDPSQLLPYKKGNAQDVVKFIDDALWQPVA